MGLLDSELIKETRDRLLRRNIVSKTVENNGLSSLLYSIGKPAAIDGIPPNIIDSEDLEDIGSTVRDFLLVKNKYIATPIEYERISIDTTSTDITSQYPDYLERMAGLVGGNPSSNAGSVINGVLGGLVPKYSVGGGNPLFDVTSILGGRNPSNETPLGVIGANQLGFAIQVNSAFNLYEETIGTINTNPISLLMGNPIIFPNYKITVAKGTGGVILDYAERILGFNTPVSLLDSSSSIFYSESGDITNVIRANNMLTNTGKGQVSALFWLMKQNKYKPAYRDSRDPNGGVNGDLYAFQYGQNDSDKGYIIEMLNGTDNNPISKSNYDLQNMVRDSGFRSINDIPKIDPISILSYGLYDVDGEPLVEPSEFTWEPYTPLPSNFSEKSILSKTKKLFESGKLKWNTIDPAIIQSKTEINSAVYDKNGQGYMPNGSGSIKFNGITPESDPQKMFFRTFNKVKQYDRVKRLQKHSGVNLDAGVSLKKDATFSVLDNNGFVKIAPYAENLAQQSSSQLPPGEVKKYMFSIENLAWHGYTSNLIPEEIGNGDPISGRKGRIMWFPPYDLSFTDNTSVNWEKTDFIGRGEPIYTYNNTTRTGNLQFKIIIDHPSYVNSLKGESDNLINSLFTGGFEVDKRVINRLTADEQAATDLVFNQAIDKVNNTPDSLPQNFELYFPYNDQVIDDVIFNGYEDGLGFDPATNPTGVGEGIGAYGDIDGVTRVDQTNYGLNKSTTLDFLEEQAEIFRDCTGCKVRITTYGVTGESPNAQRLRAVEVQNYIESEWASPDDDLIDKRFKLIDGGVVPVQVVDLNGFPLAQFGKDIKSKIKVTVEFEFDAKLKEEANPNTTLKIADPLGDTNVTRRLTEGIKSRFYTEEGYFRKLEQEDKFVYDSLSQKIGFFHPSFHSITPEGFNSRLTFLQQCTRQGPTVYQNSEAGPKFDLNRASDSLSPDNLAFGQPPVCILRLGDFYYTKIIIDSVNFSFDPLVWDLNPEGIGVQPMICTVDLNFAFIGGSSLQGPLSKLQNAVTYNFFANTQTYEPASNYLGLTGINAETGEEERIPNTYNSVGGGDYYPGGGNIRSIVNPVTTLDVTSVPSEVDQEAQLELIQANTAPPIQPTTGATADLARISVSSVEIKDGTNFDTGKTGIYVDITFTFEGVDASDSSTHLGDAYQLGTVSIAPKNSTANYSVILFGEEITLDGDSPTQIVRNKVFFADSEFIPVTDNTNNVLRGGDLNSKIANENWLYLEGITTVDTNKTYRVFEGESNTQNGAISVVKNNSGNQVFKMLRYKVTGSKYRALLAVELDNAQNTQQSPINLTDGEVTIELGELVKMERGEGEIKAIIRNVTSNNSNKYK
jgi:hypothetical protein